MSREYGFAYICDLCGYAYRTNIKGYPKGKCPYVPGTCDHAPGAPVTVAQAQTDPGLSALLGLCPAPEPTT